MKFRNKLIGLTLCALSAQVANSQHVSDRPIYATDIKNAAGTSVFNFPTSLPTASRVCTFNANSEPVGSTSSAVTAMLDAFLGDSGSGGLKGLVPAPASGDATKFLRGDATWATVVSSPGGSTTHVQFNDAGAFNGESNFVYDKTIDSVGVQVSAPLAPLHVAGVTGSQINSVVTASVAGANESLNASPTGAITLIPEFPATGGASASSNPSGSGYTASGQTIDYNIYPVIYANGTYYRSQYFDSTSYTDTLIDSSSFSVIITLPTAAANQDYFWIEKQVNGGGFTDSIIVSSSGSYEDTNFSGSAGYSAWPTQYQLLYTVPTAPSGPTGQEIDIGFGSLFESGLTYDFEIRSCTNVGGTYYCEQTGASGNFTDSNMGQQFNLQVDWTPGAGDNQVIRISTDGGSSWQYQFVGSMSGSFVWSNQGDDSSAATAWGTDPSGIQLQFAFKCYAKNTAPSGAVVYTPSADTYYGTITTPNVPYIFRHDYTSLTAPGCKAIADYNSGVTNGLDVSATPVIDPGYSTWGNGTTITPNTYAFANGTTKYFKFVGYNGTIFSPTPLVVNATTSGTQYFTGSFSFPSGVTIVRGLVSSDGVTYTGSKTFNSPTNTFTYDATDGSWGGSTTLTPTASVPTAVRIDRTQGAATDVPQLSIIEVGGSGNRLSAIGFGVAATSANAATYQSNIIGYSSTGFMGIGSARLIGYTGVSQTTESWNLGSSVQFNMNKSTSVHPTMWAGGTEPLAYFYSSGDNLRGTLYLDDDNATSISDAKFVISPQSGGTTGYVFDRPNGSSTGDALRIQSSGSYQGGIGADSSHYINRTAVDSNAWLSFGGSSTKAAIRFGGTLKTSAASLGLEGSSDDMYFTITTGTARKKVALIDPSALTSGRVPFATTNGRLTDDSDFTFATDTLTVTKAKVGSSGNAMDGVFSATATLDFGSIASNATAQLTMTVTGAAVGDVVMLGPPSTIEADLTWSAFVSAANTVAIRLHNTSGGSVDPASATWRAQVTSF